MRKHYKLHVFQGSFPLADGDFKGMYQNPASKRKDGDPEGRCRFLYVNYKEDQNKLTNLFFRANVDEWDYFLLGRVPLEGMFTELLDDLNPIPKEFAKLFVRMHLLYPGEFRNRRLVNRVMTLYLYRNYVYDTDVQFLLEGSNLKVLRDLEMDEPGVLYPNTVISEDLPRPLYVKIPENNEGGFKAGGSDLIFYRISLGKILATFYTSVRKSDHMLYLRSICEDLLDLRKFCWSFVDTYQFMVSVDYFEKRVTILDKYFPLLNERNARKSSKSRSDRGKRIKVDLSEVEQGIRKRKEEFSSYLQKARTHLTENGASKEILDHLDRIMKHDNDLDINLYKLKANALDDMRRRLDAKVIAINKSMQDKQPMVLLQTALLELEGILLRNDGDMASVRDFGKTFEPFEGVFDQLEKTLSGVVGRIDNDKFNGTLSAPPPTITNGTLVDPEIGFGSITLPNLNIESSLLSGLQLDNDYLLSGSASLPTKVVPDDLDERLNLLEGNVIYFWKVASGFNGKFPLSNIFVKGFQDEDLMQFHTHKKFLTGLALTALDYTDLKVHDFSEGRKTVRDVIHGGSEGKNKRVFTMAAQLTGFCIKKSQVTDPRMSIATRNQIHLGNREILDAMRNLRDALKATSRY